MQNENSPMLGRTPFLTTLVKSSTLMAILEEIKEAIEQRGFTENEGG